MKLLCQFFSLAVCLCIPGISQAYIGPGVGLSAIGSILAFVGVILLLVIGFVWYPIKRLLGRKKSEEKPITSDAALDKNSDQASGL